MAEFMLTTILIALTLAAWAVSYAGWGLLAGRILLGARGVDPSRPGSSFWLGWATVTLILQVVHTTLAIDGIVSASILALGLIAAATCGRSHLTRFLGGIKCRPLVTVGIGLFALWLINRGAGPPTNYDTAVYHLRMVQWNTAHAVVPGLANLVAELGFNNASFLHAALLDAGPWTHRSQHLFHPLLMSVLAAEALLALGRILAAPARARVADLVAAMFLIPLVHFATVGWYFDISSLSPDLTVTIMMLAAVSRVVDLLTEAPHHPNRSLFETLTVAGLCGAGVCVKVSTIAFAGPLGALVAVYLLIHWRAWGAVAPRAAAALVALPFTLIAVWMARNVFISGYPLYPLSLGAFNVDWAMPRPVLDQFREYILLFARGAESRDEPWMRAWLAETLREHMFSMNVPVLAMGGALAMMGGLAILRVRSAPGVRAALWTLAPVAIGLGAWFYLAPAPRFGTFLVWSGACVCAAVAVVWARERFGSPVVVAFALAVLVSVPAILALRVYGRRHTAQPLRGVLFEPGTDRGLHPPPTAEFRAYTTRSGLRVQESTNPPRSWIGPLVTTTLRMPTLALRFDGDVSQGFRMEPPYPEDLYAEWTRGRAAQVRLPDSTDAHDDTGYTSD